MCNSTAPSRYCYRCNTCLALYVTEYKKQGYLGLVRDMSCSICANNDNVEYLGKIGLDKKITSEKSLCKCDDRCVWAKGPKCDCVCGGANHQTGPEGYTQVEVVGNKVRLTCLDPVILEKHQKIAKEFVDAIFYAKERKTKFIALLQSNNIRNTNSLIWNHDCKFRKASVGRAHSHRIKKLAECYNIPEGTTNVRGEQIL